MDKKSACRSLRLLLVLAFAFGGCCIASAEIPADGIDFNRDVRPILAEKCFHCHGPDQASLQADLRLDSREAAIELGGVIVPGKPEESPLIERIFAADPEERMPPQETKLTLTGEQKRILRDWVDQGANWQRHWSLEPPSRPALPEVAHRRWSRNAIDSFILARLESEGLQPSPQAARQRLIRRVSLDLTGLPPTLEEVKAFLADTSEQAYEKVVDRLLASPHYGERMAWNWLDAARYADSNGYQGDPERTMWPWRDWVVRAINDNMPFDRFTTEQIAGDLLPEATLQKQIATGFNRNNMHNGEGGRIPEESRVENVMDRAETVATVWLGLTMTCCRCHDHKYDPLTMRDYYRFYAFFNNTSETGKGRSGQMAPTVTFTTQQDDQRLADLRAVVQAALPPLVEQERQGKQQLTTVTDENPEEISAILAIALEDRNVEQLEKLLQHFQESAPPYAAQLKVLRDAVADHDRFMAGLPKVMVMDDLQKPRKTFILTRGAYDKPAEAVKAGIPQSLSRLPSTAARNRLGLAAWLLATENPLTSRVIVNRYWQLFFSAGLVRTPEDFGTQGSRPTHPLLLDWLATEFRESGWDVKQLHRLIVTSATYQQSSRLTSQLRQRDPENQYLARGPRHRLPSWMLRDQALAASGLLVSRFGGPAVKPYQPENIWAEATFGKKKYVQDEGERLYRRSLYTFWRRIVGPTMFFDTSKRQTCHVTSSTTNTPLHALTILNDITFVEAARVLAQRVMALPTNEPAPRLAMAFRLATARQPRDEELTILVDRFHSIKAQFASQPQAVTDFLAIGESPRDESLDPTEHASYAAICSLILNLDETLTKE
jgi:hypothetical protein